MERLSLRRSVGFCAIVILLAGCAGAETVNPAAQTSNEHRAPLVRHFATGYTVLFNFDGKDGAAPLGDLLGVNDTLYGTTSGGGANGMGTVFSITTAGTQRVLYSFKGGSDGRVPTAGVIEVGGTLYGTTYAGGNNGDGTVFSLSVDGAEAVLHSFSGGSDGAHPRAPLVNDAGTLYGTTEYGGGSGCAQSLGCGTVYSLTKAGTEAVLYSFQGGKDGRDPRAGLALIKGVLYGTTRYGGTYDRGTVFGVTTTGTKSVLWNFEKNVNGGPNAPEYGTLFNQFGQLLGAASAGVNKGCGGVGCGALYSVDPKSPGTLEVVTGFSGGKDGGKPVGSVTYDPAKDGSIVGTTLEGGTYNDGTIYALGSRGLVVLHSFSGGKDGGDPYGGLTFLDGSLYGTTNGAGSHGTVFAVTP